MERRYTPPVDITDHLLDVWAAPDAPEERPYSPHPYQLAAIDKVVKQACAGLFLDPGLGKTSIMLAAYQVLREKGLVKKALVVAPLRPAYAVWPAEVRKWADFADINIQVLHGKNKSMVHDPNVDIHVINPEGLPWLLGERQTTWTDRRRAAMQEKGVDWFWDMLIVDESTRFKHTTTQRYKVLRPWLRKFARRYILTGSPAPNGLLDLFGQVYLLDEGASLGRYITRYRQDFFDPTGFGGYTWVPKKGAAEEIEKRLAPLVMRLSAADYLKLPPLIENVVKVQLPREAMRTYKQMETLLVAQVVRGMITAANAASAVIKCRQIANGGVFDDETKPEQERRFSMVHDAKTEAAMEIVEELQGQPALIAYEFTHDRLRLQKAFPDAPYLGGGVSMKEQERIIALWNAGLIPVLLAQPQSTAHGLNLQGTGSAVIFYGLTWDLELRDQFIRRVWRQGQEKPVVVHYLVAEDTVDEVIMRAIDKKEQTQNGLLEALKTYLEDTHGLDQEVEA